MKHIPTSIHDVIRIDIQVFKDERGFFMETYQENKYAKAGITDRFVQDNHSGSRQGTLRGLHYQIKQAQGKLVSLVVGKVYDVAVDLRRSSPNFGKWVGTTLSANDKQQLWIPPGFAHGFYVLSEWADVIYKVTDYYATQWERTLLWNDPELNINWPLINNKHPILSWKDAQGKLLQNADVYA